MGRKGSWFSSVKRVFISDSKKDQKHHHRSNSKLACFGHHHHFEDPENAPEAAPEEAAISVVPSLPRRKEVKPKPDIEADNEQSKQAFSLVLATAVAAGAAVAAAEAARLNNLSPRHDRKTNEEIAAVKIQTAFRGYWARKSLRALRGLSRLKKLVKGQSVQRQAATTLQCMQTLSRLQTQVNARKIRMSEENQSFQRQLQQKRDKEFDKPQPVPLEKWDDSSKSKEQIRAKLLNRQVAAMRREKALAYASTHQQTWRNSSKSANATFMDPNNPHWGWNWLERWMAARPWEGQNTMNQNNHASGKSAASHTMTVGEITKLYSLRDQNQEPKNSPKSPTPAQKHTRSRGPNSPTAQSLKPPSNNGKANTSTSSPKVNSWGGDGDSTSIFNNNSGINRRHSIAGSQERDNESLVSSHAVPTHTTTTATSTKVVAKAKSSKVLRINNGTSTTTSEKGGSGSVSANKRLSLPASPSSARRNSVSNKVGSIKNVAANTILE